jgi:hypothetical protein
MSLGIHAQSIVELLYTKTNEPDPDCTQCEGTGSRFSMFLSHGGPPVYVPCACSHEMIDVEKQSAKG